MEKGQVFNEWSWNTYVNFNQYLTSYTKRNSKCVTSLSVELQTINLPHENQTKSFVPLDQAKILRHDTKNTIYQRKKW